MCIISFKNPNCGQGFRIYFAENHMKNQEEK